MKRMREMNQRVSGTEGETQTEEEGQTKVGATSKSEGRQSGRHRLSERQSRVRGTD